ncbi:small multi-drug export protein [Candidatus Acetothermia bacterium]|nr:small multi-drug export protein [Candidatus Acetothermia bacterium]MBI3642788.1 small multi-drug export protein [Candidatus Acetothermia bacterium]
MKEALIVVGVAALPISELRGAIPLAILQYHMPPLAAFGLAVMGNLIPILLILAWLGPLVTVLSQVSFFSRIFDWLFATTRKHHSAQFERWGKITLVILVALPVPVIAGAWTGALVAFLFNVPFWQSFRLIALGVLIAGLVITLGTLGVLQIF